MREVRNLLKIHAIFLREVRHLARTNASQPCLSRSAVTGTACVEHADRRAYLTDDAPCKDGLAWGIGDGAGCGLRHGEFLRGARLGAEVHAYFIEGLLAMRGLHDFDA